MGIRVTQPGLLTTVQDLGRTKGLAQGFSPSGVMDQWSAIQGNLLVNNVENEAVLEYSILGPTVTFSTPAVIAVTGGVVNAKLNGTQIHENQAIEVNSEDVLEIGPLTQGRYGYLAVSGGLQVDSILASKATSLRYGLGGFKGRALKTGDFLATVEPKPVIAEPEKRKIAVSSHDTDQTVLIRVTEGPQFAQFDAETITAFTNQQFKISKNADRMGLRLEGQPLSVANVPEMLSEATVAGGIQVPKNGQPIVLMADRQTTGGYPVIGVVASVDLPTIAQLVPGQVVRFKMISLTQSQQALADQKAQLKQIKQTFDALNPKVSRKTATKIIRLFR